MNAIQQCPTPSNRKCHELVTECDGIMCLADSEVFEDGMENRMSRSLRRFVERHSSAGVEHLTVRREHDLWPVKNVKDLQRLSRRAEAVGILDQSRSDRFDGADRTACAGRKHQDPDRARVRPRRTPRLTDANRDPS